MTKEEPTAKERRDYWSDDGQIFFTAGFAYGLTPELKTICLGSEEDVNQFLNAGDNGDKFTTSQLEVLEQIKIYREGENIGEPSGLGKRGVEGVRPNGRTGADQDTTRQPKTLQRLPLRQTRSTVKSVSGK